MLFSLEDALDGLLIALRDNPRTRFLLFLAAIVILFAGIVFWMAGADIFGLDKTTDSGRQAAAMILSVARIFTILSSALLIFIVLSFTHLETTAKNEMSDLKTFRDAQQKIQIKMSEKDDLDVIDTIRLNLYQLNEYYAISKRHARTSFGVSVTLTLVGIAIIAIAISLPHDKFIEDPSAILASITGFVTEFIGATAFIIYKNSLIQLNSYFEQLVKMQYIMLGLNQCEKMPAGNAKEDLRAKIVLALVKRGCSAFKSRKLAFNVKHPKNTSPKGETV